MAKYGTFNYGSGTNYGSTAELTDTVTWIVQVDWDGDGVLDGANEAVYLVDCSIHRGVEEYLNGNGSGFEHMRVGTATLVFENGSGRYDPRNASSPLYPNVKPGKRIMIRITDNSDESQDVLFSGIIDMLEPEGYRSQVTMNCVDYMQWLNDQELTFSAELFNTTITGAFNHLLTQAAYPGGRLLDDETQPVWVFAVNEQSAASVAAELADAGLGIFWIDKLGRARYQKRDHSESGTARDQTIFLNDPRISQPWDGVYNAIEVTALRYVKQQPAPVFTLPEPVYIADGDSETVYVTYDPSTEVQIGELTGNTRADGDGTDVTLTATTVSLGLTGGSVTVANNSGTNAYLVELTLRGRMYADTEQRFSAEDSTSQSAYGIRRFYLKNPYLQDRNYASGFATILKDFLKDDRESLRLQLRGRPSVQFFTDLMDFVEFTSTTLNITAVTYQLLGLEHEWLNDNGQDVVTTWHLHKTLADSTSITSSSLDVAPRVPPAPGGYNGSGVDSTSTAGTFTVAVYHNGVLVGSASELNFLDSDYSG